MHVPDWILHAEFLQVPALRWLLALLLGGTCGFLALITLRRLGHRFLQLGEHGKAAVAIALAAALQRSSVPLVLLLFILLACRLLAGPELLLLWLDRGIFLCAALQLGLWANAATQSLSQHRLGVGAATNPVVTTVLAWFVRILVWATLILAVLANVGVNITAFVASLGIGGVAMALALQNVLGDLFASLSIGLDKPFAIGDFIAFDDKSGHVLRVGIKTTRVRAQSGEELVIGNAELLSKPIHNYGRLQQRFAELRFGVVPDTPAARVDELVQRLRLLGAGFDDLRLERAHFVRIGDSALEIALAWTTQSADYGSHLDVQQRINLQILELLAKLGVRLAAPLREIRHSSGAVETAR